MAKIPEQIDKYKIVELIATGGMGAVFRGIHPTLKRPVILKKLTLRGNATITERFKREARILMDFRNDNIVDVQDHFVQGRSHYIVMEYINGPSVKDLLDEQRYLDNSSTAYIILYTARALQYAHSKGVIHRDIKPGNILISAAGDIKLADFGIAATNDSDSNGDALTMDGTTLGTPAYMAPEQFENSRTVDHRADLYSLGIMMYEMLTGLKPFPGGFTPETIRLIQKGRYKKPSRINPAIAPELQRIIHSLIKPRPKSRCSDIRLIIRKLERWLGRYREEDVRNRLCATIKEETLPPLKKSRGRRVNLAVTAGIILLAAAAAGIGYCGLTGFHRLILQPGEFGRIRLQTDYGIMPQSVIFIDDGKDIPAADRKVRYIPYKDKYRSPGIVLQAGNYRIKTIIGEKVIWSSFLLKPWKIKNETMLLSPLKFDFKPVELQLSAGIHDAVSGRNLEETAVLEIFKDGKFQPAGNIRIFSGEVHNFRITAPAYESQEYILKIQKDQRVLHFQAELIPIKGAKQ